MKHYRSLLLLPFVLTGCATTDMQGALDSLNGLGHSIGTSLSQAATPASAASRNSLWALHYITPCATICLPTVAPRSGPRW